jgi:hypothetical protein
MPMMQGGSVRGVVRFDDGGDVGMSDDMTDMMDNSQMEAEIRGMGSYGGGDDATAQPASYQGPNLDERAYKQPDGGFAYADRQPTQQDAPPPFFDHETKPADTPDWQAQIRDNDGNPSKGLIGAISDGLHHIAQFVGLGGQGAIAGSPETQAARQNLVNGRPVDGGEPWTGHDQKALTGMIDPNESLNEGMRNIAGMESVRNYYLNRGEDVKAAHMAASMMQYSVSLSQRYGDEAVQRFYKGDVQGVADAFNAAKESIADGTLASATPNPDGQSIDISGRNLAGKELWRTTLAPREILATALKMKDGSLAWHAYEAAAGKYDPGYGDRVKARAAAAKEDAAEAASKKFSDGSRPYTPAAQPTAPAIPDPTGASASSGDAPSADASNTRIGANTRISGATAPTSASNIIIDRPGTNLAGLSDRPAIPNGPTAPTGRPEQPISLAQATNGGAQTIAPANPANVPSLDAQDVELDRQEKAGYADIRNANFTPDGNPLINGQEYTRPDASQVRTKEDQAAYNNALKNYNEAYKYAGGMEQAQKADLTAKLNSQRQAISQAASDARAAQRARDADARIDKRADTERQFQQWKEQDARTYANVKPLDDQQLRSEVDPNQGGAPLENHLAAALLPSDQYQAVLQGRTNAGALLDQNYTKPELNTLSQAIWNGRRYTHDISLANSADLIGGLITGRYMPVGPATQLPNIDGVGRAMITINRGDGTAQSIVMPEQDALNLKVMLAHKNADRQKVADTAATQAKNKADADAAWKRAAEASGGQSANVPAAVGGALRRALPDVFPSFAPGQSPIDWWRNPTGADPATAPTQSASPWTWLDRPTEPLRKPPPPER